MLILDSNCIYNEYSQGFKIVWTEIQDTGPSGPSTVQTGPATCESADNFQCQTGFCISEKLRCDGVKNCAPPDGSDEMHCES